MEMLITTQMTSIGSTGPPIVTQSLRTCLASTWSLGLYDWCKETRVVSDEIINFLHQHLTLCASMLPTRTRFKKPCIGLMAT